MSPYRFNQCCGGDAYYKRCEKPAAPGERLCVLHLYCCEECLQHESRRDQGYNGFIAWMPMRSKRCAGFTTTYSRCTRHNSINGFCNVHLPKCCFCAKPFQRIKRKKTPGLAPRGRGRVDLSIVDPTEHRTESAMTEHATTTPTPPNGVGASDLTKKAADIRLKLSEDDKMYVLKAELPGVPKEDLLVEVSDERMLQLSVVQDLVKVEREDYHTKERAYRGFYHEIRLPPDAQWENALAIHKDGLLTLTIPREAPRKRFKISIL